MSEIKYLRLFELFAGIDKTTDSPTSDYTKNLMMKCFGDFVCLTNWKNGFYFLRKEKKTLVVFDGIAYDYTDETDQFKYVLSKHEVEEMQEEERKAIVSISKTKYATANQRKLAYNIYCFQMSTHRDIKARSGYKLRIKKLRDNL